MVAVENMDMKDVQKLEKEFEKVPHVQDVLWYDDVADISLPTEMIPKDIRKEFINGDATMMLVLFDDTTSSDNSMEALTQLRKIANKPVSYTHLDVYKRQRIGYSVVIR